jgi:hypothetical protein
MAKPTTPADPLFSHNRLNVQGVDKVTRVQDAFTKLLRELEGITALGGREGAIVRTKLEEACFYAKKNISLIKENQEPV